MAALDDILFVLAGVLLVVGVLVLVGVVAPTPGRLRRRRDRRALARRREREALAERIRQLEAEDRAELQRQLERIDEQLGNRNGSEGASPT
jgi:hypothetical protein